ncbi:hypothetical protein Y032_0051g2173 [Ancylostoma ceylanicum]|uniref:Uncharacterized protein n=1 Tax=Ancylostoma ceylanicum TaxID=53326 RepID=A0A016U863_9BILA|nr:hypothetical protein Y032_0051g2173 [Ancylostoma ceylanicum]
MVEFTVVHYYTKFNTGDPEIQALEREKMRQIIRRIPKTAVLSSRRPYRKPQQSSPRARHGITRSDGGRHSMYHRVRNFSMKKKLLTPQFSVSFNDGQLQNIQEFQQDSVGWRLYYWMINNGRPTDPFGLAQNSISAVDRFSRIALLIYFGAVVVVYYNFYVNTPYDFTFDDDYIKNPL